MITREVVRSCTITCFLTFFTINLAQLNPISVKRVKLDENEQELVQIQDIHNSWLYCFTNPLELGTRVSLLHRQSYVTYGEGFHNRFLRLIQKKSVTVINDFINNEFN